MVKDYSKNNLNKDLINEIISLIKNNNLKLAQKKVDSNAIFFNYSLVSRKHISRNFLLG